MKYPCAKDTSYQQPAMTSNPGQAKTANVNGTPRVCSVHNRTGHTSPEGQTLRSKSEGISGDWPLCPKAECDRFTMRMEDTHVCEDLEI